MIVRWAIFTTRLVSRRTTSTTCGSFSCTLATCSAKGEGVTVVEIHQLPFSLGDDLLGDDQDIAAAEGESLGLRRLNDDLGEIDARRDVWRTLQSDDAYFGSHQVRGGLLLYVAAAAWRSGS